MTTPQTRRPAQRHRHPADRRPCARRWSRRRWATTCSATIRASMRCRRRSRPCSASRRRCSCRPARRATSAAILSHCQRGDEYIVGQMQHCYRWEGGGAAVFGSVQPQPLDHQPDGSLALADIEAAIKPDDPHFARTRLLALENTLGGKVLPFDYLRASDGAGAAQGPGDATSTARACSTRRSRRPRQHGQRSARAKRAASRSCSTASRSASARAWARRSARRCAARAS